jgi:hypothetical protein
MRTAVLLVSYLIAAVSSCEETGGEPSGPEREPSSPREAASAQKEPPPLKAASSKGETEPTVARQGSSSTQASPRVKEDVPPSTRESSKGETESSRAMPEKEGGETRQEAASQTAVPLHTWKKGDKLERVIRDRYDIPPNRDWTDSLRVEAIKDLVLKYNTLESEKRIPEGRALVLPSRDQIYIEAGLPSELREPLQHLFRAESLYYEHCERALDYMCNRGSAVPPKMKADFIYMAEKVLELKTRLETKKNKPLSRQLNKALRSLTSLHQGFTFTIDYRAYDQEHCDFAAKDITATKRTFSNLSHQLYKWSLEERAFAATGPQSP